jgi:hypothetical protein
MSEVKLEPGADQVQVPWTATTVGTAPPTPVPVQTPGEIAGQKAAAIDTDIAELQALQAAAQDDAAREALQAEVDYQRRRQDWFAAAAARTPEETAARVAVLEAELGAEAGYLETGLPPGRANDQRLLDQLGELAIMRLALR